MSSEEWFKAYYVKNKKRIAAKQAAYYAANKDKVRALQKAAYLRRCEKDPTYHARILERQRRYNLTRIAANRAYQKTRWGRQRYDVMVFVAGPHGLQCRRCGYDEYPALQIDHVNGGGRAELREFKDNRKYLEHIKQNPTNYQILCANCNWLKKYEKGEHPNKNTFTSSVEDPIS